jgi:peroxiredoxin
MRKLVAFICLIVLFSGIAILFWYNQLQYSLPTPVPLQYHMVNLKEQIDLAGKFKPRKSGPVFLHFFNPDCPCSKFNMPHFKLLANEYGDKINFAVVVISKDKTYTAATIRKKYDLTVPVLLDSSLAAACGVYSTPQAALLDDNHTLYYRGNYNRSRYCTDKKTNYAQMAIDSLLAQQQQPAFNKHALTAYGCSLPTCKK